MTTPLEQTILALENRLQTATLQNDVATTDELLADNWLNINANGTISDKPNSLKLIPQFHFLSIQNEEVQVRLYPGVAVVTGKSIRQLQGHDQQVITSRVLFTRVYAQPNGQWQVVTSQATPLAQ
jgi:Domain of unknown function (DUF4440)